MKSLTILAFQVLNELGDLVGTDTTRDIQTVASRSTTEGFSFLTITLPSFAKDFERSLELGRVLPTLFVGFRRAKGACLPAFLQGFTELVFDRCTGELLDVPSTDAIFCIRQVCYLFQKIRLPSSQRRVRKAFSGYIECDKEVSSKYEERTARPASSDTLGRTFLRLYGDICSDLDRIVYDLDDELIPRHGSGSTADRLGVNERWGLQTWTERLERVLPHWFMCEPNEKWAYENRLETIFLAPELEPPVRVIQVPKTLKTPRIIAMEPAHMQYVQQALSGLLVPRLENSFLVGNLIGFTDQDPNRVLACRGSEGGHLATLDLSEASDRVSNWLVQDLFSYWPHLSEAIQGCRSKTADVPGFGVYTLAKFASMGSALTFPIEAMIFLSVIIDSMFGDVSDLKVFRHKVKNLDGMVRVYGDDLIVPQSRVQDVIRHLEAFGFKVNENKSFWNGRFRESCGKDYYAGTDVSVVRFRESWPKTRQHVKEIAALVSFRNQLYWGGLWQTARFLDTEIATMLNGIYPPGSITSPGLVRQSVLTYTDEVIHDVGRTRWNAKLQRTEIRSWQIKAKSPIDRIDDIQALRKCLIKRNSERDDLLSPDPVDLEHLLRAGRPKSSKLLLRWTDPFEGQ